MDRLNRTLAGLGLSLSLSLALTVAGTGCRSTRSEIPARTPFTGAGPQAGAVGFGSTPNAVNGMSALPAGGGQGLPGTAPGTGQFGTPAPGAGNYGAPTTNSYGPPGTSSLAAPPSSSLGSGLPPAGMAPPSLSDPSAGLPQVGTGPAGPAAGNGVGNPATGIGLGGADPAQPPTSAPFQ